MKDIFVIGNSNDINNIGNFYCNVTFKKSGLI